jgi:sec-independent protein translocase protein TatB
MFDVGFSELFVIALVALIVLGPKRLPEVARAAGRWMAKIRRFVSDVKQDFDREMRNAELTELHQLKQDLDETRRMMEDTSGRLMQQIGDVPSSGETPTAAAEASKIASSSLSTEPAPSAKAQHPPQNSATKKIKKASATRRAHGQARTTRPTKRA